MFDVSAACPRLLSSGQRDLLTHVLVGGALVATPFSVVAQGAGLAGLYAAAPPAGSAFVRVVQTDDRAVEVHFDRSGPAVSLPSEPLGNIATPYRVAAAGQLPRLLVNGVPLAIDFKPRAGAYTTWALVADGSGHRVHPVQDELPPANALRAVLRLTNLVPGCEANLSLSGGGDVFSALATWQSKARLIQPVKAGLVVRCGLSSSLEFTLPLLQAGDRYSLFVVGTPAQPALKGQIDSTVPFAP